MVDPEGYHVGFQFIFLSFTAFFLRLPLCLDTGTFLLKRLYFSASSMSNYIVGYV